MQPIDDKKTFNTKESDTEALEAIHIVSDPTRLQIMRILSDHGALCAHEILSYFDISQPTLSHHMSQLCEHKLVESKKEGRRVFYSISEVGMKNIIRLFEQMLESSSLLEKTSVELNKSKVKVSGIKKSSMLPSPKKVIKKPDVPKENVINKSKSKKKSKSDEKKKNTKKSKGKKKGKKKNG